MKEDVQQCILERMQAAYMPPQQVRQNPRLRTLALAEYEQALEGFSRFVLEQAWAYVRDRHPLVIWPPVGLFVEACRYFAARETQPSPEEARRQQALARADAYTTRYLKTSVLARRARSEGWLGKLREYVAAAAWVQAQLLCGVRHLGFDAVLLGGEHLSAQEGFEGYRNQVSKELLHGEIKVRVPPARIKQWQEQADLAQRTLSEDGPRR